MSSFSVCVDASIVVDRILQPRDMRLGQHWHEWKLAKRPLIAPQLIYYEATNVFYQKYKVGEITESEVKKAVRLLLSLSVQLFVDTSLHERAIQMAHEFGLGATYDAHYLALAWQQGAVLYTRDARFARAVQAKYDWIQLV
jgi:predicted nucleic acid-binding protein